MDHLPIRLTSRDVRDEVVDEERKALLSEESEDLEDTQQQHTWRVIRVMLETLALCFVFFCLGYFFVPPLLNAILPHPRGRPPKDFFDNQKLRSNGTHDFKKTALIVSIDGLRYV